MVSFSIKLDEWMNETKKMKNSLTKKNQRMTKRKSHKIKIQLRIFAMPSILNIEERPFIQTKYWIKDGL